MDVWIAYTLAGLLGISLAAACGMRVFAPLAVLSVASFAGWMTPPDSFAWVGSAPVMVGLCLAVLLEAGAYMIPWLDHALDTAGVPLAAGAGTVVAALQIASVSGVTGSAPVDPGLLWTLSAVAGGGVALGTHATTAMLRGGSTGVSGGLLNPVFAIAETALSVVISVLSIVIPVLAVVAALGVVALLVTGVLVMRSALKGVAGASKKGKVAQAVA
ncbi:MAG: DUF4126 domain-containing protein [Phycisphaerales bacterium]|nr:DUF4126 domain-containing protein [Phycisphaerales bacterium]